MQVSDGKDVGESRVLRIMASPLRVAKVANTGLVVPRGGARLFTPANLTFVTNAASYQSIDVNYLVLEPPFDGEIQRLLYTDDTWSVTSDFTQSHVTAGRLRYVHYNASGVRGDYFRFRVSALGVDAASEEHEFHIRVVRQRVEVIRSAGLRIGGSRDSATITSDALKATSTLPYHGPADVSFRLVSVPRVGNLMRSDESQGRQRRRLVIGSTFTQADIANNRILYRLTKLPEATMRDDFRFRVSAPGAEESTTKTFEILYEPDGGDLWVVNNGLMDVYEGGSKIISPDDLWIERRGVTSVEFAVVEEPRHGVIQLINHAGGTSTGTVVRGNVTTFTSADLHRRRIRYQHDDSESQEDHFQFSATLHEPTSRPENDDDEENTVEGIFVIKIVLRNDNPPQRAVYAPLHVVNGGGRVLDVDDIAYTDPDVDFDSAQLEYEWEDVTNGQLVLADNRAVPVYLFSQRELADGVVYFQHRAGSGDANMTILVSDGAHTVTGVLQILASEPFIRAGNGTTLIVERGKRVALTPANLAGVYPLYFRLLYCAAWWRSGYGIGLATSRSQVRVPAAPLHEQPWEVVQYTDGQW